MLETLTCDQRFALRWLARGFDLWLHTFAGVERAMLQANDQVRGLERSDFDMLLRENFIRAVRTIGRSTVYELTDLGWQTVSQEQGTGHG